MRRELKHIKEQYKYLTEIEDNIKAKIKEKYPLVTDIWFTDGSINITTKHHTLYLSRWTGRGPKPEMRNCGKDMPATEKEMLEKMREIKQDHDKLMGVGYYVAFRYPIFEGDDK